MSSCVNTYFTPTLSNALACGTVPIWWGCSGINKLFDMNGIITINPEGRPFNTFATDEFERILEMIGPDDYKSRSAAIKTNYQLVEQYRIPENVLWKNVLSELYNRE